MNFKRIKQILTLIIPIIVKESTSTAAPVANICNLIGWSKLPVNMSTAPVANISNLIDFSKLPVNMSTAPVATISQFDWLV